MGVDAGTDSGNLQASGAGAGFERFRDAGDLLVSRAGCRAQLGAGRNHHVVADRNVSAQVRIVNVADSDVISALLDGRIAFQLLHSVFRRSHPVAGADVSGDTHLAGAAGANVDGAGTGFDLQVHGAIDLQGAIESALDGGGGEGAESKGGNADYDGESLSKNWQTHSPSSFQFIAISKLHQQTGQGIGIPCS